MQIEFQGKTFPVLSVEGGGLKVMYLNRTRNIAGTVKATNQSRLTTLLMVQARCCRDDATGMDELEPRP